MRRHNSSAVRLLQQTLRRRNIIRSADLGIWLGDRLYASTAVVLAFIQVDDVGRADFLLSTLLADDSDQVRATKADLLVQAKLIEISQVTANHEYVPFEMTSLSGKRD